MNKRATMCFSAVFALGCVICLLGTARWGTSLLEAQPASAADEKTRDAAASTKDDQEERAADRKAIRQAVQSFIEAFERGEAALAAAHMTSGAELIPDDAPPIRGQSAIEKAYADYFAKNPKRKIALDVDSLRFTSRDTAIEEGQMKVTPDKGAPSTQRYSILHVREGGKWLMAVIREWPSEKAELRDLDWLIGTWDASRKDAEVHTTYEWFGDKSFIRGNITVRQKDQTRTGVQWIGEDPRTGELRIWVFESDGGFAEGTCTRDGNSWLFETEGVLPEGDSSSSTNLLIRVNNDTLTWQPVNLTRGDEQITNLPPVKVTRSKPK